MMIKIKNVDEKLADIGFKKNRRKQAFLCIQQRMQ